LVVSYSVLELLEDTVGRLVYLFIGQSTH